MKVKENLNKENWIFEIEIELEDSDVKNEVQKKVNEIKKSIAVPGFRKGKVPENYIRIKYKDIIKEDFSNEIKRNYIIEYFKDKNNLFPLDFEEALEKSEVNVDSEKGGTIKFSTVIFPFIELKKEDYTNFEIKIKKIDTKSELENRLKKICNQYAYYEEIDKEMTAGSDVVINADIIFKVDGEKDEDISKKNTSFYLDSIDIPELKENLIGKKKDDEFNYKIIIPENASDDFKEYIGKEAEIFVKIYSIKEKKVPELDNSLAIKVGYDSIEDLKSEEEKKLEKENLALQEEEKEENLFAEIIARTNFNIPEKLIEKKALNNLNFTTRLFKTPLSLEELLTKMGYKDLEDYKNKNKDKLIKDLKKEIILAALVKNEKIELDKELLESKLELEGKNYNMDKKEFRRWLINEKKFEDWKSNIIEDLTIKKIISENKFIEE